MKKIVAFFLISLSFSISSCNIFEEEDLINSNFLGTGDSKVWKLKEYKINGQDNLIECLKDDTFIFNTATGKYSWKKNSLKCSNPDPDIELDFVISEDNKNITVAGNEFTIIQFDHGNLKIKYETHSLTQELWYVPI